MLGLAGLVFDVASLGRVELDGILEIRITGRCWWDVAMLHTRTLGPGSRLGSGVCDLFSGLREGQPVSSCFSSPRCEAGRC